MIVRSINIGNVKYDINGEIIKYYHFYPYRDREISSVDIYNGIRVINYELSHCPSNNYLLDIIYMSPNSLVGMECFFGNKTIINTWNKLFIKCNKTNELYELFIV